MSETETTGDLLRCGVAGVACKGNVIWEELLMCKLLCGQRPGGEYILVFYVGDDRHRAVLTDDARREIVEALGGVLSDG